VEVKAKVREANIFMETNHSQAAEIARKRGKNMNQRDTAWCLLTEVVTM
jgi:hypothetical protein